MNFIKSTYIAVLFVIEEKKGVSTKGGPQFLRCLHTKEKQLKKIDESRHVDRYFKNKIIHFLLSISFISFQVKKKAKLHNKGKNNNINKNQADDISGKDLMSQLIPLPQRKPRNLNRYRCMILITLLYMLVQCLPRLVLPRLRKPETFHV